MTREIRESVEQILRLPYKRTLIPEEEGGFSALIEEFPGCYAQGETMEEAYANLESAARSWLEATLEEGRQIPQPMVAEANVSGRVLLRLPKSLHRRIKFLAERDGVSLNQFCVMALTEAVTKAEIPGKPLVLKVQVSEVAETLSIMESDRLKMLSPQNNPVLRLEKPHNLIPN